MTVVALICLFHKAALAVRMSHTTTTVVASFKDSQDGCAAYQALRDKCLGGSSGDTIVSLFEIDHDTIVSLFEIDHHTGCNVDAVVNLHNRISQRVKGFDLAKKDPAIFIDTMLKMHLLMLISQGP